jgi:hypothetical protein
MTTYIVADDTDIDANRASTSYALPAPVNISTNSNPSTSLILGFVPNPMLAQSIAGDSAHTNTTCLPSITAAHPVNATSAASSSFTDRMVDPDDGQDGWDTSPI